MKRLFFAFALLLFSVCLYSKPAILPSYTVKYCSRDTVDLYMDIYDPAEGSLTSIDGKDKPSVLFVFGGGFMSGARNKSRDTKWYKQLSDAGYRVIAIDYRLGLKNVKGSINSVSFIKKTKAAIDMAVEDLYAATNFLLENGSGYGVDARNMVISGSSAGAITVLQAEWEICNGTKLAALVPSDFNYAGVMSFSGAIFSTKGRARFVKEPCPVLLFHGTDDKVVKYRKRAFMNIHFDGSHVIAKGLKNRNQNYCFYRFSGKSHEIAIIQQHAFSYETEFIERNVMKGEKRIVDALLDDPEIITPEWAVGLKSKDLYK